MPGETPKHATKEKQNRGRARMQPRWKT